MRLIGAENIATTNRPSVGPGTYCRFHGYLREGDIGVYLKVIVQSGKQRWWACLQCLLEDRGTRILMPVEDPNGKP